MACLLWFKKEDKVKENKLILWSTDCFHMTHKDCFLSHLFKLANIGSPITCPKINCNKIVHEQEFTLYLGNRREEFNRIIFANVS